MKHKNRGHVAKLAGQRFGLLTVIAREGNQGKHATWRCRCQCGREIIVRSFILLSGKKQLCHLPGHSKSLILQVARVEYVTWQRIRDRCYNSNTPAYKNYGARGIKVCAAWLNSFEQFLSDMGPRPSYKHSIDRYPDTNGNYEPNNCRWATSKEQNRNMRKNVRIEVDGKLVVLADYLESIGADLRLVRKRIRRGWKLEDALTTPRDLTRVKLV